uniref:(northern house mosquito) hypothetical protein n=1 Tax=Culex pipiens TaxID=7175 RepID=A0A8D8A1P8_CULPI
MEDPEHLAATSLARGHLPPGRSLQDLRGTPGTSLGPNRSGRLDPPEPLHRPPAERFRTGPQRVLRDLLHDPLPPDNRDTQRQGLPGRLHRRGVCPTLLRQHDRGQAGQTARHGGGPAPHIRNDLPQAKANLPPQIPKIRARTGTRRPSPPRRHLLRAGLLRAQHRQRRPLDPRTRGNHPPARRTHRQEPGPQNVRRDRRRAHLPRVPRHRNAPPQRGHRRVGAPHPRRPPSPPQSSRLYPERPAGGDGRAARATGGTLRPVRGLADGANSQSGRDARPAEADDGGGEEFECARVAKRAAGDFGREFLAADVSGACGETVRGQFEGGGRRRGAVQGPVWDVEVCEEWWQVGCGRGRGGGRWRDARVCGGE